MAARPHGMPATRYMWVNSAGLAPDTATPWPTAGNMPARHRALTSPCAALLRIRSRGNRSQ
eukprot:4247919-Pyramimonas_sp.AAC.1